jgi:hypothetical protein
MTGALVELAAEFVKDYTEKDAKAIVAPFTTPANCEDNDGDAVRIRNGFVERFWRLSGQSQPLSETPNFYSQADSRWLRVAGMAHSASASLSPERDRLRARRPLARRTHPSIHIGQDKWLAEVTWK